MTKPLHLTPEERAKLVDLSRLHRDSPKLHGIRLEREGRQVGFAILQDDLQRIHRISQTNDPDPISKATTNGHRREIPGD